MLCYFICTFLYLTSLIPLLALYAAGDSSVLIVVTLTSISELKLGPFRYGMGLRRFMNL